MWGSHCSVDEDFKLCGVSRREKQYRGESRSKQQSREVSRRDQQSREVSHRSEQLSVTTWTPVSCIVKTWAADSWSVAVWGTVSWSVTPCWTVSWCTTLWAAVSWRVHRAKQSSSRTAWSWRWSHNFPSKRRKIFKSLNDVTTQTIWIFIRKAATQPERLEMMKPMLTSLCSLKDMFMAGKFIVTCINYRAKRLLNRVH
jgi:hypothetical protein